MNADQETEERGVGEEMPPCSNCGEPWEVCICGRYAPMTKEDVAEYWPEMEFHNGPALD